MKKSHNFSHPRTFIQEEGPVTNRTDRELLDAYDDGDVEAIAVLVDRHRRSLFGFILNMTGNSHEADDVFQETWFKALRSLHLYREGNFAGWVIRIARNVVIDKSRRKKPQVSLDADAAEGKMSPSETIAGNEADPAAKAHDKDLGLLMRDALASLSAEQKEVFMMRAHMDLSFKEIAEAQGVSVNTALARMHYAIARLKPLLKDEYENLARR